MITSIHLWRQLLGIVFALAMTTVSLAGPDSTAKNAKANSPGGPTIYPLPPDPPRIQHLATFTGERDFAPKRTGFAKFIAGEEKRQDLVQIYGVGLFQGKLYAVDSKLAAIAIFDLEKQQFSMFSGTGGGKMKLPINITIDADGTKYVTDTGRGQVLVYDLNNAYVGAFGEHGQFRPVDTAIAGDRLYVVDILHHQIQVLDKRSGKLLLKFGKVGSKAGELFHPTNIAIAPNGDLLVAETNNFRIQRFTPDGKSLHTYGEAGDTPGKFARPKGVAVDRKGRFYVADAAFQNIQVFGEDGKIVMAFGQPEKGEGLSLPAAVKIDYNGIDLFKRYADPKFTIEYLILVTSQVAPNKVDVFGFGRMAGKSYPEDSAPK